MAGIDFFIMQHIAEQNAQDYVLETESISTNTTLQANETFFVERVQGSIFAYHSIDEVHDHTQGERLTKNKGFIDITQGSPILIGTKVTITKHKPPLDITLITDEHNMLQNIKVE